MERVEIVTVTPQQAREWLEHNTLNRTLNSSRVANLSRWVLTDHFELTNDAVVFGEDGVLYNGQHRLEACVKADQPIRVIVLWDAKVSMRRLIDRVRTRSSADVLTIERQVPKSINGTIAAGIALLLDWEEHEDPRMYRAGRRAVEPYEVVDRYDLDPEGFDHTARLANTCYNSLGSKRMPRSILAACAYRFSQLEEGAPDDTVIFLEKLGTGANLAEDDPIFVLRRRLDNEAGSPRPLHFPSRFAWLVKTWNYWRKGDHPKSIGWRAGGASPEAFPVPE